MVRSKSRDPSSTSTSPLSDAAATTRAQTEGRDLRTLLYLQKDVTGAGRHGIAAAVRLNEHHGSNDGNDGSLPSSGAKSSSSSFSATTAAERSSSSDDVSRSRSSSRSMTGQHTTRRPLPKRQSSRALVPRPSASSSIVTMRRTTGSSSSTGAHLVVGSDSRDSITTAGGADVSSPRRRLGATTTTIRSPALLAAASPRRWSGSATTILPEPSADTAMVGRQRRKSSSTDSSVVGSTTSCSAAVAAVGNVVDAGSNNPSSNNNKSSNNSVISSRHRLQREQQQQSRSLQRSRRLLGSLFSTTGVMTSPTPSQTSSLSMSFADGDDAAAAYDDDHDADHDADQNDDGNTTGSRDSRRTGPAAADDDGSIIRRQRQQRSRSQSSHSADGAANPPSSSGRDGMRSKRRSTVTSTGRAGAAAPETTSRTRCPRSSETPSSSSSSSTDRDGLLPDSEEVVSMSSPPSRVRRSKSWDYDECCSINNNKHSINKRKLFSTRSGTGTTLMHHLGAVVVKKDGTNKDEQLHCSASYSSIVTNTTAYSSSTGSITTDQQHDKLIDDRTQRSVPTRSQQAAASAGSGHTSVSSSFEAVWAGTTERGADIPRPTSPRKASEPKSTGDGGRGRSCKEKIDSKPKSSLSNGNKKSKIANDKLVQQLIQQEGIVDEHKGRVETLLQALEQFKQKESVLQSQLEDSLRENDKLREEMERKNELLGDLGEGCSLQDIVLEKDKDLALKQSKIEKLEQELKTCIAVPQLQIQELEQENKSLQGRLKGDRLEFAAKLSDKAALIDRLRTQIEANGSAHDDRDTMSIRQKLSEARTDTSFLREELDVAEKDIKGLQEVNADLLARNIALTDDCDNLRTIAKDLDAKSDGLVKKVLEWTAKAYEWKSRAELAERKLEAYKNHKQTTVASAPTGHPELYDEAIPCESILPQSLFLQAAMDKKESMADRRMLKWNLFGKDVEAEGRLNRIRSGGGEFNRFGAVETKAGNEAAL